MRIDPFRGRRCDASLPEARRSVLMTPPTSAFSLTNSAASGISSRDRSQPSPKANIGNPPMLTHMTDHAPTKHTICGPQQNPAPNARGFATRNLRPWCVRLFRPGKFRFTQHAPTPRERITSRKTHSLEGYLDMVCFTPNHSQQPKYITYSLMFVKYYLKWSFIT